MVDIFTGNGWKNLVFSLTWYNPLENTLVIKQFYLQTHAKYGVLPYSSRYNFYFVKDNYDFYIFLLFQTVFIRFRNLNLVL